MFQDILESQHSQAEAPEQLDEGKVMEAISALTVARQNLKGADLWISEAGAECEGFPIEYRVLSLMDGVEDMINAVDEMINYLKKEGKKE